MKKQMKAKKILCMGMAALLTFSSMPEMMAWAEEAVTAEKVVAEEPVTPEETVAEKPVTPEEVVLEDVWQYSEQEDGTLEITGYRGSDTELEIPDTIEGKKVTSIGNYAFWDCSGLTSIEIPSGVTSIGDGAFYGCSGLTSIEIPSGVTSIGNYAFNDCSKLTDISVDERNQNFSLLDGVLFNKEKTELIVCPEGKKGIYQIPSGVTSIWNCAFYGCSGLTSIEISSGVTSIGSNAFYGCSGLTSIEIPSGVTSVGSGAFFGCSGLTSIEILSGVTSIGSTAFFGCSGLTSIKIPSGVTSIGSNAFNSCGKLTDISVDERNQNFSSLDGVLFNKEKTELIVCPEGKRGIYQIPSGVTSIGDEAFYECSGLTSIEIPSGVTSIGRNAFSRCSGLTSIEIPSGVTSIGHAAFSGCSGLISIIIPSSVTSIGEHALFDYERRLTIYGYADSVAYQYALDNGISFRPIDEFATEYIVTFDANGGTGLSQSSRTVKSGETIGELPTVTRTGYTLKGWVTQETGGTVVTADTVVTSNMTAYAQWEAVKQDTGNNLGSNPGSDSVNNSGSQQTKKSIAKAAVTLSASGYSYDGKAKTPTVKSVTVDGKALTAGTDYTVTYKNNTNIGTASVILTGKGNYNGTVTKTFTISAKTGTTFTVGSYKYKITSSTAVAFAGLASTKTTKVTIPKTVKIGGKTFKVTSVAAKALYKKTKVTSITAGANVTTIGASAFEGCTKLTKVTIGSNVTKLGNKAFKNCTALKSLTVPAKVTSIESEAFYNCKKLATLTIKTTKLKTVGKNALKGIKSTAKIKVPSSKLTAYKKLFKSKGQGSKVKIAKS